MPPEPIPNRTYVQRVAALHRWSSPETMGGTTSAHLLRETDAGDTVWSALDDVVLA